MANGYFDVKKLNRPAILQGAWSKGKADALAGKSSWDKPNLENGGFEDNFGTMDYWHAYMQGYNQFKKVV